VVRSPPSVSLLELVELLELLLGLRLLDDSSSLELDESVLLELDELLLRFMRCELLSRALRSDSVDSLVALGLRELELIELSLELSFERAVESVELLELEVLGLLALG